MDNVTSDGEIVGLFYDKYSKLYNSVLDDDFNVTATKVENLIISKCNKNQCSSSSNHNVSTECVKNAISCLKTGKSDETYNVYSDHFINATDKFNELFGKVISIMIKHGTANQILNKSIIKPIPKDKSKSLSD